MNADDLNVGNVIRYEKKVCRVTAKNLHGHGKAARTVNVKLKDVESGQLIEHNFKMGEKVETANAETVKMVYSYPEDSFYVFMNNQTYEEVRFEKEKISDQAAYLTENSEVEMLMVEDKPVALVLPETATFKVLGAPEGVKGTDKEAELENGLKVLVPHFVTEGDSVVIKTADGSYVERVTTKSLKTDQAVPGTGSQDQGE